MLTWIEGYLQLEHRLQILGIEENEPEFAEVYTEGIAFLLHSEHKWVWMR